MSDEKQHMIAAAGELEQTAQDLGRAFTKYRAAYGAVSRAAHPNANRQLTLEQTVGSAPLNSLIVRRLRALGLGPMLDQARTAGTIDDLAAVLRSNIAAHVS